MILATVFIFGLVLIALPLASNLTGSPMGGAMAAASLIAGCALVALAGVVGVFTRLYRKTKSSEAFVRTGSGGVKVIRDGGAIVIPVLHELVIVSLRTLKLEVSRQQEDAMITLDKLRADIRAEFFVRVQPDRESILQASRSLGEKMADPAAVKALVEDKLVSALRTAAAGKTLEQLNSERDEFLLEVTKLVGEDLRNNGLVLETVTISRLDQTDESFLKKDNIFDAQGRRKIAEITQENLTERNRLVREGEQSRKSQDVQARQRVLELSQAEKEAEARQAAEVAKIEAETRQTARVKEVEAERLVELAQLAKQQSLEVAERDQQRAVEVAERAKQEHVARAEMLRTAAEQELAEAEAGREKARQAIESVRVAEEAERAKRREVIEAEAQAETAFVASQRKADAEAYAVQRSAEARKMAADADTEAIRKNAEVDAEAKSLRAAGERAEAMVPVEVERAKVALERERLETVVKPELQARQEHGQVAQGFELEKLRIEAERTVRIATAEASATMFSKMEAKLFGTPEEVNKLLSSVVSGQSVASAANAFFSSTEGSTTEVVEKLTRGLGRLATSAATELPASAAPNGKQVAAEESPKGAE